MEWYFGSVPIITLKVKEDLNVCVSIHWGFSIP